MDLSAVRVEIAVGFGRKMSSSVRAWDARSRRTADWAEPVRAAVGSNRATPRDIA